MNNTILLKIRLFAMVLSLLGYTYWVARGKNELQYVNSRGSNRPEYRSDYK